MEKLTQAQKLTTAKAYVADALTGALNTLKAETVKPYTYAVPTTSAENDEIWVTVTFTAKQFKATENRKAYDPFAERADYEAEQEAKATEAAIKTEEKERKKRADAKRRAEKTAAPKN